MSEHCYRLVGCNRAGYPPESDPVIVESWNDAIGHVLDMLHDRFPDGSAEQLVEEITSHEPALGAVFGPDAHGYVYYIDRAP